MSSRASRAARTFSILFSLPLFLFPALVVAQVSLEVEVGFHGVFELGQPFPLTVNLTNLGRPVEGILEVKVWKGGAFQRNRFVSVHLQGGPAEVLLDLIKPAKTQFNSSLIES